MLAKIAYQNFANKSIVIEAFLLFSCRKGRRLCLCPAQRNTPNKRSARHKFPARALLRIFLTTTKQKCASMSPMTLHYRKSFCENNTKTVSSINSLPAHHCGNFLQRQNKRVQGEITPPFTSPTSRRAPTLEAGDKLRLPSGFTPSEGAKKTTEKSVVSFASFAVKPRERSP